MRKKEGILHRPRPHMQANAFFPAWLGLALLITLLVALSACETLPAKGTDADTRYLQTRADRLARAGRPEQAAELYEQAAAGAAQPDVLWLAAARQRYAAGQWPEVIRNLELITTPLAPDNALEQALLGASANLYMDDPGAAEIWLEQVPATIPERARPDLLWVQTQLALAQGKVTRAIELVSERELWLTSSEDLLAGRRALLEAMQARHRRQALPETTEFTDPLLAGWLELARTLADADRDPFVVRAALRNWQALYPGHPAEPLLPELLAEYRRMLDFPQELAVLLPMSGRLQAAGDAVRDGIMAAYLRHGEERPRLRFYDASQQDVTALYNQAVLDGAELVIGPLTRNAVSALSQTGALPVPTLALNNLPAGMPPVPGLYQFGLAPEDEARQAARRVLEDGLSQGIALTPANEWGRRLLEAFTMELEEAGGVLLDHYEYEPRDEDFSTAITTVLHLAESRQRHRALSGVLGRRIEFEPRRRQDLQFIFLASTAETGRLMRPQLRFHYASSLPVYATSAIYEPSPERNGDLNGVMFDDVPWTIDSKPEIVALRQELSALWPEGMRTWPRLYALGFDAYRLVPALFSGQLLEDKQVQGLTGDLSLTLDGRVHRTLMWAKFEGGVPVLLESSDIAGETAPDSSP